jgi:hypothetical protein
MPGSRGRRGGGPVRVRVAGIGVMASRRWNWPIKAVLPRLLLVVCLVSCATLALTPESASELSSAEEELKQVRIQLERHQLELKTTLEKLKNAFTQEEFRAVFSRIQTEPEIIIFEDTSPLQVKAAHLVRDIKDVSDQISEMEYRARKENDEADISLKKNVTAFLNRVIGKDAYLISIDDPANEALGLYGLLVEQVRQQFKLYLASSNFLSRSEATWFSWLSQARNILSNQRSRFRIARHRVAEYRIALRRIQEARPAQEMALEIALRSKALDVFAKAISRMEREGGSIESTFAVLCPDSNNNVAKCEHQSSDFNCVVINYADFTRACSCGCCPWDLSFAFRTRKDAQFPDYFGALHVLNRRTFHFLNGAAAHPSLEARARTFASQPLYRQSQPIPTPGNDPSEREARSPTFAGLPTVPLPALIVVRPSPEYPLDLEGPGGGPPRNPATLSSELTAGCVHV